MTSAIELLDNERLALNKILVNKALYSQYLTPPVRCPFYGFSL